jgi:signal transduction histidine kinase
LTLATPAPDHPPGTPVEDTPAGSALVWVFAIFPVILRLTCGIVGGFVALAVRTPPVATPLLMLVVAVLTGWSLLFTAWTLRRGLTTPIVGIDLVLTAVTCLLINRLVAAEVLPGEGSWVAILASTTIIVAQFALPASRGVPAGLAIAAAYTLGAHLAGDDTEAVAHLSTLVVQTICGAGLAYLVRRSSRTADEVFAGYQRISRDAVVARAAREAERRHNRDLHDTVLSTLTVVGLGAVGAGSPMLRERAASDLRTLAALATSRSGDDDVPPAGAAVAALHERLGTLLDRRRDLRITATLERCEVPAPIADAIVDSAAEALSNVSRHAPDATVAVSLTRIEGAGVAVEIVDDGPGFDPATVPLHRFGLRESVHGRMAAIEGRARVDSTPGRGTRVRLEWPHVR